VPLAYLVSCVNGTRQTFSLSKIDKIDLLAVVDKFSKTHRRRMQLDSVLLH